MTAALLSSACWYLSHQSDLLWQAGVWHGSRRRAALPKLVWKPVLNCQNLATWFSYIEIWWINSKVPEGSMITSPARESSRVIILKSRLNSTGHSACRGEVCDIFDRQTFVPNDWWQLMYSNVLQLWDLCNSITAPVRYITLGVYICWYGCLWMVILFTQPLRSGRIWHMVNF